ncbi:MAG: gamma-glutamyltransferase, partial [Polyangiaceae bacterium]
MSVRRPILILALALAACTPPSAPSRSGEPAAAKAVSGQPVAASPRFPPEWPFAQGATSPASARGMVATDAALATQVGAEVLANGGNAVDAAVAAA